MKMIKFAMHFALALTICLVFFWSSRVTWSAEEENHCFTCHTNAGKLIKITREIQKANKDKPGGSAETEGEG
ncbi:MAG: hypothetical protein ACQEQ7_13115 [Thermodesulfobacteriota bacterium]